VRPPEGTVFRSFGPFGPKRNAETELLPGFTASRNLRSAVTITAFCEPSPAPVPRPVVA
jgi:hypothetical protein